MPTIGQPKYYIVRPAIPLIKESLKRLYKSSEIQFFFPDRVPIKISIGGIKCLFKCYLALFVVPVVRRCHFI